MFTFYQSLSETVANAMEHDGGQEVSSTVKFDKFFDCLNVKSPVKGWHKCKDFQDPYLPPDGKQHKDERLKV